MHNIVTAHGPHFTAQKKQPTRNQHTIWDDARLDGTKWNGTACNSMQTHAMESWRAGSETQQHNSNNGDGEVTGGQKVSQSSEMYVMYSVQQQQPEHVTRGHSSTGHTIEHHRTSKTNLEHSSRSPSYHNTVDVTNKLSGELLVTTFN